MTRNVPPVPKGFHTVTPYLIFKDAAPALDWYARAFGATELFRKTDDDGKIRHAEFRLGDAVIMLSDEYPERKVLSPQTLGGTPVATHLYVDDVDGFCARAVAAGATLARPVADQFYGDRSGQLEDPFGHRWFVATRVEDVSVAEMQRRYDAMMKGDKR